MTLSQHLNDYCPPFVYFGSHEGNGADFGFWVDWDAVEDAEQIGDLIRVDAGDEWPEDLEDAEHVLEVTGHGSGTLYDARTREEVWSVV